MKSIKERILWIIGYIGKEFALFVIGGIAYMLIEIAYRHRTHWSMGFVGGLCFLCVGLINEVFTFEMRMEVQAFIGTLMITIIEFISGCILNLQLGWNIWDYSRMPFNIKGQICLPFMFIWFWLAIFAIWLDDKIRAVLFHEENYKLTDYKWWFLPVKKLKNPRRKR